jgi:hypothetical protein
MIINLASESEIITYLWLNNQKGVGFVFEWSDWSEVVPLRKCSHV